MSDTTNPAVQDDELVDDEEELDEEEGRDGLAPQTGQVAIYPELDREGGTTFKEGGPDTEGGESTYEDWAKIQAGTAALSDEDEDEVDAEDEGDELDEPAPPAQTNP